MTVRRQVAVVITMISGLAVVVALVLRPPEDEFIPVAPGAHAPAFSAVSMDSGSPTRTLASYQGKLLVLNVWATWCVPCKAEMPSFERLHRQYGDKGLAIVAVSIDGPGKETAIRDFTKRLGLTFEILGDPDGNISTAYQTTGVPETFVIDTAGVIVRRVAGAEDWTSAANSALIASLLGVPTAGPPAATPARSQP